MTTLPEIIKRLKRHARRPSGTERYVSGRWRKCVVVLKADLRAVLKVVEEANKEKR